MFSKTNKRNELARVINHIETNADHVEKNILDTEEHHSKDVLRTNEGKSPVYEDTSNNAMKKSLDLLNDLDVDIASDSLLQHPQANTSKYDIKQFRERAQKLNDEQNRIYHLAGPKDPGPGLIWSKVIDERMASLNSKTFGQDLPTVESEVKQHDMFHKEVEALASKISQADKDHTENLQLKYDELLASSTARQKNLLGLRDYMQRCTAEVSWLNDQVHERIMYDWSDTNLDYPARSRQYENFIKKCLENKEATITKLFDDGENLVAQGHPGKNVFEAHMDVVHEDWKEYLNLLICEDNHLKHMDEYHKFQVEARETEDMLKSVDTEINHKYNPEFKDQRQLKALLTDLNVQSKAVDHIGVKVKALRKRSTQVRPLKYRRSPQQELLSIEALCDFHSNEGAVKRGERYTLMKNNGHKWEVKDSAGRTLEAPGVCFAIPPTDPDSVSLAENLLGLLSSVEQKVKSGRTALQSRLEDLKKDNVYKQIAALPVRDAVVPAVGNTSPGPLHTITGEISGVVIQKKKECNQCHQIQRDFNAKADTHKCECCKMLQKSPRYTSTLSGTIVVLASNGNEAKLILTSPVIMKYLRDNHLGDLVEHPDSVEKHFVGNERFQVSYDEGEVRSITRIAHSGKKKSLLKLWR